MKLYKVTYLDSEYYPWYVLILAENAYEADQAFRHYRPNSDGVTIEEVSCSSAVIKTHKYILFDEKYKGIN